MNMTYNTFFDNFFTFDDTYSTKNYKGKVELDARDWVKALRCELELTQLSIQHAEGAKSPNAFFWNGVLSPFCINEELKMLFEDNNITGVKYIPANVKDKNGELMSGKYFAVCIQGRIGPIDYFRSEVIFKESPSGMIVPQFKGEYFNESSWDGSDFVMTRPDEFGHITASIYTSRKVRDLFKKHKISFVKFTSLPTSTTDSDNILRDSDEFMRKLKAKIMKATPKKWLIQKAIDKTIKKDSIKWDLL
ncbi:MAG: hypothetical protein R3A43_03355 [Bacteroidia bacterium]